jgi:hypothetical protein
MVLSFSGPLTRLSQQGRGQKQWRLQYAMLRGPNRYESGQNKINLDTVIYLTFFYQILIFFSNLAHLYL